MTIFPCRRCGDVPEVTCYPGKDILTMAVILHECSNGRRYCQRFNGIDQSEATDGVIYRWNEAEVGDNPKWWPERYDYLRSTCRTTKEAPE